MSEEELLDRLVNEFGLQREHVYLLNLVPLIEVMWADGRLQDAELSLFYQYATEWLVELSRDSEGEPIVSAEQANAFIDQFTRERPDPRLLQQLRDLAFQFIEATPQTMRKDGRDQELIDWCMDIAAAAVAEYPYHKRDRVTQAEKELLRSLIRRLGLG